MCHFSQVATIIHDGDEWHMVAQADNSLPCQQAIELKASTMGNSNTEITNLKSNLQYHLQSECMIFH